MLIWGRVHALPHRPWRDCATIKRYERYWAVYDTAGVLVCVCLYRKGAEEVVRRLQQALEAAQQWQETNRPTMEVQAIACKLG